MIVVDVNEVKKLTVPELKQHRGRIHKLLVERDSLSDKEPGTIEVGEGLNRELEALNAEIRRKENQMQVEADTARSMFHARGGDANTFTADPAFDEAASRCSFFSFIALGAGLPGVDVGRAREISSETSKRAGRTFQGTPVPWQVFGRRRSIRGEQRVDPMTTTLPVGGPGGNLIGVDHMGSEFVQPLYARLELARLGSRVIGGLRGDVDIPKLSASAEAAWFAENSAIGLSSASAAALLGSPKFVGSRSELSRPLVLQADPRIEQIYSDDFLNLHRRAIDRAAIAVSTVNGPTGILGTSGIDTSVTWPPDWSGVLQLIQKVEDNDAQGNGFLTCPSVVQLMRSTAKVSGTDSVMVQESPNELAGYPLGSTTLCPSSTLIFGNFADVLILVWEAFDLLVNPYSEDSFSKGNIQIRMISAVDVIVRHGESFAVCSDSGS